MLGRFDVCGSPARRTHGFSNRLRQFSNVITGGGEDVRFILVSHDGDQDFTAEFTASVTSHWTDNLYSGRADVSFSLSIPTGCWWNS